MKKPFEPSTWAYRKPPTSRLHFVLVQVSARKYVVAQYDGKEFLSVENFPKDKDRPQHIHEFQVVSEPLDRIAAVRRLEELLLARYNGQEERESPILSDEPL